MALAPAQVKVSLERHRDALAQSTFVLTDQDCSNSVHSQQGAEQRQTSFVQVPVCTIVVCAHRGIGVGVQKLCSLLQVGVQDLKCLYEVLTVFCWICLAPFIDGK